MRKLGPATECLLDSVLREACTGDVLLAYILDCEQHGLDCVKTPEAASEVANQLLQHAEPRWGSATCGTTLASRFWHQALPSAPFSQATPAHSGGYQ